MRKLIYYFLVLLLAVWVGLKIAADPGYLLIAYQKNTIEMPLWLAVLAVLLLFFILYFVVRTISNIRSLAAKIRSWSRQRRVRRAWQRTHRGLIALYAGDWKLAEKDLIRAAGLTDTPIINYLSAAKAAQAQGALTRRDDYLYKIEVNGRLSELALGLTQARLQIRQHQYEQALATLQRLQQLAPKHKPLLKLLVRLYLRLQDWAALETLLPVLEKYNVYPEKKFTELQTQIYYGLLKNAQQGSDAFDLVWQRVPKSLRTGPQLLTLYVKFLAKKDPDEAEEQLRRALEKELDGALLWQYGLIFSTKVDKQLHTAENWLKAQPKNPILLLTLGRLSMKNQLWGKARSYFEASLGIQPQASTYFELAKLLEQLNETNRALEYYRAGLALSAV
jgi:HemY protein